MLTKSQFDVLFALKKKDDYSQRKIAQELCMSVGKANKVLNELKKIGYIDGKYHLLNKGYKALNPYKVENAIIMAAGTSSRFAPLSYEKPKGLLKVKGDILIEREIEQLIDAGIEDITIVVGYMKEKFFYLKEKYNVQIVVNEDYYRFNNTSTLMRVLDRIGNTYICSSDNYFVENVFQDYVYTGYYASVMIPGPSDEFGLITDNSGKITKITHTPNNMYCMLGHVYFNKEFSKKFCEILKNEYETNPNVKYRLWEYLYEEHIKELPLYIKKYDANIIKEFDSLEELRTFDEKYLENTGSNIFKNICKTLLCEESEIMGIEVVNTGLTNLSFAFTVKGVRYIYRHPGVGTEKYISRKAEAFSMKKAKELHLNETIIYISPEEGWKISYFVTDAHTLDYHSSKEVDQAVAIMQKLHEAKIHSEYDFGIWDKTLKFIENISKSRIDFNDFDALLDDMTSLYQYTEMDQYEKILCHCDCYSPNFLVDKQGNMTLIDWEYSGNDDPGCDIGTFICCSDYTFEEALQIIDLYYRHNATKEQIRHMLAYVSIASYYWFIWAIYQESIGKLVGDYLLLWYENAKTYKNKALELYRGEKNNEK